MIVFTFGYLCYHTACMYQLVYFAFNNFISLCLLEIADSKLCGGKKNSLRPTSSSANSELYNFGQKKNILTQDMALKLVWSLAILLVTDVDFPSVKW